MTLITLSLYLSKCLLGYLIDTSWVIGRPGVQTYIYDNVYIGNLFLEHLIFVNYLTILTTVIQVVNCNSTVNDGKCTGLPLTAQSQCINTCVCIQFYMNTHTLCTQCMCSEVPCFQTTLVNINIQILTSVFLSFTEVCFPLELLFLRYAPRCIATRVNKVRYHALGSDLVDWWRISHKCFTQVPVQSRNL